MTLTAPAPAQPPRAKKPKALIISTITVGAVLLASLGGLGWILLKPTTTEVMLQPAGYITSSPFAEDPFAGAPDPALATPIDDTGVVPTGALNSQTTNATDVAIYGGSGDHQLCDAQKFVEFMKQKPAQAQAWVDALNADPKLSWKNGTLTVAEIPDYVNTLVAVVLMSDTLVTNHDFVNQKPVPYQSVLQAGTAVLVDMWGVPRLQCYCGNPLTLPPGTAATTTFVGTPWAGFSPGNVTNLTPPAQPVTALTVANLNNPGSTLLLTPASSTSPAATPAPTPSPAPTPTGALPDGWFVKPTPPTPSTDLCAGVVGNVITTVPGDVKFPANNTSPVEVDIWNTVLTWQAQPGGDPAYGGTIDSCTMQYVGSIKQGTSAELFGFPGGQWAAFEGVNGTGPVATKVNGGDAWSIQ